jgi:hypothetical protein
MNAGLNLEGRGMETRLSAATPMALAQCRRAGALSDFPLHQLGSRAEAEAFQVAAVRTLGGDPCGYKIGATGAVSQQLLHCREPIYGPI